MNRFAHSLIAVCSALGLLWGAVSALAAEKLVAQTPGTSVSDSLGLKSAGRSPGAKLSQCRLETGDAVWTASPSLVFLPDGGVSIAEPAGGSVTHPIAPAGGRITVQAELRPGGSGFTGLAVGRPSMANDFWKAYDVLAYITPGGTYEVLVRGKSLIKGDKGVYGGLDADGFAKMLLELDAPGKLLSVSINGHKVLDARNVAAMGNLAPTTAGFRINERATPGQPAVRGYSAKVEVLATSGFVPAKIEEWFAPPDEPVTVALKASLIGAQQTVPYQLRNYSGRQVAEGTATLGEGGILRVQLGKLARGYYDLGFPASQESFGLAVIEAQKGPADPFFCMDSGLSWLETRAELRPGLVAILRRSGIAMSRERLSWGGVNPDKDKWNWEGGIRQYASMRGLYADASLPILEILHGGAKHLGMGKGSPYPQDLSQMVASWRGIAAKFASGWGGAEIWNEPDLIALPGDQYAALTKTAAYALPPDAKRPIVGGVYGGYPPGAFFDTCLANGMLDQVDAVSFHGYDRAPDVARTVKQYREWLRSAGKETMPLWSTECGMPWSLGPDRAPLLEDAVSAMEISMKAVESRACGVERYFPFVYTFYEEGGIKNFGMMGREVTPMRSMAAYAYCAQALAGMTYLGDLDRAGTPLKLARVFGIVGRPAVAVLYTGKVDAAAVITLPLSLLRVEGADGRTLSPAGAGEIPIPDGMAYVWLKPDGLGSTLKTDTPAAQLLAVSQQKPPARPAASSLVLTYLFQKTPSRPSASRYLLDEATAKSLPINVRVHNLGDKAQTLDLRLQLPGENEQSEKRVQQVQIPPQGTADATWTVDAHSSLDVSEIRLVRVTAAGASASPLAIPFVMEGSLETHLSRHAVAKRLPISDMTRWQPNIAGHGTMKMTASGGGWRLEVSYTQTGDAWVYPRFELPERLDATWASGIVMRARIKNAGRNVGLMAYGEGSENYRLLDLFPADGAWHAVYVPFTELKPGPGHPDMQNARMDVSRLRRLEVGFGSSVLQNEMEISDLVIVGGVSPTK